MLTAALIYKELEQIQLAYFDEAVCARRLPFFGERSRREERDD